MSEFSILRGITRADIRHEPYAHIVVEGCLPAQIYSELAATYPDDETILRLGRSPGPERVQPNSRHDVGARHILGNPDSFACDWLEFVKYHVSNVFFREFIELLGPEILSTYPHLERRLGRPLRELRTGILDSPDANDCQIALDCHIGINTPSRHRGSVRRVHTDAPDELFAALIYFRAENDRAAGGDLEICRWKGGQTRRFVGSEVDESDAEQSHTVITNPNTAVIFINSANALHAVSPRSPSVVSRRLVNIMGRVPHSIPEGLFEKRQKKDWWSRGRRALQGYRIAAGRF
ncbi:MAG TPA: hypothetical protein VGI65_19750 [Steroidobacteraceae bacterium]|jgi:hypothetical protein